MYRITYDEKMVFNIHDDKELVTGTSLSAKINTPTYLDFTISILHPLYNTIQERAGVVKAYSDDIEIFEGYVESIDIDTYGYKKISSVSALDYLNDTHVRPYSTVPNESQNQAPDTFDGYFKWLIDEHNKHVIGSHQMLTVGVNQANMLQNENHIYEKNEGLPKTAEEIQEKLINKYGGYLSLRLENGIRFIDFYNDVHNMNTQIIDFGTNITDFEKKLDTKDQYTAIRPEGATPQKTDDPANASGRPITIESIPDDLTGFVFDSDIKKRGDVLYSQKNVDRYGYHETVFQNNNIDDPYVLLGQSVVELKKYLSPVTTISVKAVDLSLFMSNYQMLQVGQAVRVRSKFHKEDEYLLLESIDLDLNNPEQSRYTLGAAFDTLTGQQSKYLKDLNSSINASLDAVNHLSGTVTAVQKDSIISTQYQYSVTDDPTDIPADDLWTDTRPEQKAGKYLWQKSVITYGDGHQTTTQPVMISGNSASVLHINSSAGNSFKNNQIDTVLSVSIFYGSTQITDIVELHKVFGETAHLSWFQQKKDDTNGIVIDNSDSRLSKGGFELKVSPQDVDEKTIFTCSMDN